MPASCVSKTKVYLSKETTDVIYLTFGMHQANIVITSSRELIVKTMYKYFCESTCIHIGSGSTI